MSATAPTDARPYRTIPEIIADHGVDLSWQQSVYRHLHANADR